MSAKILVHTPPPAQSPFDTRDALHDLVAARADFATFQQHHDEPAMRVVFDLTRRVALRALDEVARLERELARQQAVRP